jgi:hypothetical protein
MGNKVNEFDLSPVESRNSLCIAIWQFSSAFARKISRKVAFP